MPRLAAIPKGVRPDSPIIHHTADQHGSLQSNQAILDEIEGILTAKPVIRRAAPRLQIGVKAEPIVLAGERIQIHATVAGGERVALEAKVIDELGKVVKTVRLRTVDGTHCAEIDPLVPGAYRLTVGGVGSAATAVSPVTQVTLIWPEPAV